MSANLERALILFNQGRPELTERELRQALANRPRDPLAHALLSLCLAQQQRLDESTREAEQALHLAPDLPFAHYALASVLHDRGRLDEAAARVDEAIQLDPYDADHFALLANIRFDQRRWQQTLEAAEHGLEIDSEHVGCANLRAMALVKLGQGERAGETIDAALARDPNNAVTHANRGWALLHQGHHERAQVHFREALRINPQLEWARDGIVQSLKARNPIYALLLRYFLWMGRLSGRAQWGVLIAGYLGYRLLSQVSRSNPSLAPIVVPVLVAYGVFAVSTWLADPLFNLLLRLDRFGRYALTREQIVASNWIGGCLLLALVAGLGWLVARHPALAGAALLFGALLLPLAGTFQVRAGRPRLIMGGYTAVITLIGCTGLVRLLMSGAPTTALAFPSDGLLVLALAGAVFSSWIANVLALTRAR